MRGCWVQKKLLVAGADASGPRETFLALEDLSEKIKEEMTGELCLVSLLSP